MNGFVLAGGASSRMGQDKAQVVLPNGLLMGEQVARALDAVCDTTVMVRRHVHPWPGRAVIADRQGPRHALTGVATALAACLSDRALVAPCDLPWLTPADIVTFVSHTGDGEGMAVAGDEAQPLLAVLFAHRADDAWSAACAGRSVRRFMADVPRIAVRPEALRNANHPGELPRRA